MAENNRRLPNDVFGWSKLNREFGLAACDALATGSAKLRPLRRRFLCGCRQKPQAQQARNYEMELCYIHRNTPLTPNQVALIALLPVRFLRLCAGRFELDVADAACEVDLALGLNRNVPDFFFKVFDP
jgi:hypothetical protein